MARNPLPPGFRFHPTDVELVMYYLKKKVMGKKCQFEAISELNIYKYSPWDLPDKSLLRSKDLEWYFFCPKERKYASGVRANRLTETGFWKSTGKDRPIFYNKRTVGMVKTLVFHTGHSSTGERTNWVMYEYRIVDKELEDAGVIQDSYVICKVFQKSGLGPKNGAQYGAPFNEEDWDDDDAPIDANPSPHDVLPLAALPDNSNSVVTGLSVPESGPSQGLPLAYEVPPTVLDNGEDINFLLDMFTDDSFLPPDQNENSEDASFPSELFPKAGTGPETGAQYGALSNDEDCYAAAAEICADSLPCDGLPLPALQDGNISVVRSSVVPGSTDVQHFSEPGQSQILPSASEVPPPVTFEDDDIIFLLNIFKDNGSEWEQ